MSDRARALEILRRARDLLADRLTERILEAEEGLLDDARGDSYLGDIDSVFDQFGTKLAHLNQLINNLPLETEEVPPEPPFHAAEEHAGPAAADAAMAEELTAAHPAAITGPLMIAPPALPAPRMADELEITSPNFHLFSEQMQDDELLGAARTLSILLDISEARGMQCVRVFHRRWQGDDAFLLKAMQLRNEVLSNSYNGALMLLAECFGLVGIEALGVLQTLRARLMPTT